MPKDGQLLLGKMGCRGSTAAGTSGPSCTRTLSAKLGNRHGHAEASSWDVEAALAEWKKAGETDVSADTSADDTSTTLPPSGQTSNSSQECIPDMSQVPSNVVLDQQSFEAVLRAASSLVQGAAPSHRAHQDDDALWDTETSSKELRSVLKGIDSTSSLRSSARRVSFSETPADVVFVEPLEVYRGTLQRSRPVGEFVFSQDLIPNTGFPGSQHVHIDMSSKTLLPQFQCLNVLCCVDERASGDIVFDHDSFVCAGAEEEEAWLSGSQVLHRASPFSQTGPPPPAWAVVNLDGEGPSPPGWAVVNLDDEWATTGQVVLS